MGLNHNVWPKYGAPDESRERPSLTPFGGRLRALRKARDLSQAALGARAGVSQQLIQRLERGQNYPTLDTLNKLSVGLNMSVGEITGPKAFADADTLADLVLALEKIERDVQGLRQVVTALVAVQRHAATAERSSEAS